MGGSKTGRSFILGVVVAVFLLQVLPGPAQAAKPRWKLGFKLSAGTASLPAGGGDLELFRQNYEDWAAEWDMTNFKDSTLKWDPVSCYSELRFELLFHSGKFFGFSLGCGALAFSSRGDLSLTNDVSQTRGWKFVIDEDRSYRQQIDVKAVPLEFNFYFFVPVWKRISLYAYAGPGIILGKLDHVYEHHDSYKYNEYHLSPADDYARETLYDSRADENARGGAIGFQGGMGALFRLAPFVSLGFESSFRLAQINSWTGTGTLTYESSQRFYRGDEGWGPVTTESGTLTQKGGLWLFYLNSPDGWEWTPEMFIRTDEPQGEDFKNVRRVGVNFNSFRFGFVLRFHL